MGTTLLTVVGGEPSFPQGAYDIQIHQKISLKKKGGGAMVIPCLRVEGEGKRGYVISTMREERPIGVVDKGIGGLWEKRRGSQPNFHADVRKRKKERSFLCY